MPAKFREVSPGNYEITTTSSPKDINEVALYFYMQWIAFASGTAAVGGRRIEHPTDRYRSSIKIQRGQTVVSVVADETIAPHAKWIELGHRPYDMKNSIFMGRRWPMHRGARKFTGMSPVVPQSKKGALGWVIPEMHEYSPARIYATLAAKELR